MHRDSHQNMHHQPGIDWIQAARLAMGAETRRSEDTEHRSLNLNAAKFQTYSESMAESADTVKHNISIKYPASVGRRSRREPSRDSFLRGGNQFKNFQHSSKTGFGGIDVANNYDQASLPRRVFNSLKRAFAFRIRRPGPSRTRVNTPDLQAVGDIRNSTDHISEADWYPERQFYAPVSRPHVSTVFTGTVAGKHLDSAKMPGETTTNRVSSFSRRPVRSDTGNLPQEASSSSSPSYHPQQRTQAEQAAVPSFGSMKRSSSSLGRSPGVKPESASFGESSKDTSKDAQSSQQCPLDTLDTDIARFADAAEDPSSPQEAENDFRKPDVTMADEQEEEFQRRECEPVLPQNQYSMRHGSGKLDLHETTDEVPLAVEYPNRMNVNIMSDDPNHISLDTDSTADEAVDPVKFSHSHATGGDTPPMMSTLRRRSARIISAAVRDKTLNRWSSDGSSDDVLEVKTAAHPHPYFVVDATEPRRSFSAATEHCEVPDRVALGDMNVNSVCSTDFRASIASLDHRDPHLPRPAQENSPKKSTRKLGNSKLRMPPVPNHVESKRAVTNSTFGPKTAARNLSLGVKSAILNFEERILENKSRTERRNSGTSILLRKQRDRKQASTLGGLPSAGPTIAADDQVQFLTGHGERGSGPACDAMFI